jgi:hypothetical protein
MPGYLIVPPYIAAGVPMSPTGDISATDVQSAMAEIASEKATTTSVTTLQNNLNSVNSTLSAQISSVEGVALLGL